MIKLASFSDLEKILKQNNDITLDLSNLTNKDYIKTILFLSGLTYKNGSLIKLNNKVFKINY